MVLGLIDLTELHVEIAKVATIQTVTLYFEMFIRGLDFR